MNINAHNDLILGYNTVRRQSETVHTFVNHKLINLLKQIFKFHMKPVLHNTTAEIWLRKMQMQGKCNLATENTYEQFKKIPCSLEIQVTEKTRRKVIPVSLKLDEQDNLYVTYKLTVAGPEFNHKL